MATVAAGRRQVAERAAAVLAEPTRAAEQAARRPWWCEAEACDGKPHAGFGYKHARAEQRPPPGAWFAWWVRGGRGMGKTRCGAEWAKERGLALPGSRGALVAATFADVRDTMVEGESGLLSILAPSMLRGGSIGSAWNRSIGELYLANGAHLRVFSSEKPGRLRGPQHHYAWGDEPAEWYDANVEAAAGTRGTTWSNLRFGLRLGEHPQVCLTGTPKTVRLILTLLWRDGDPEQGPASGVAITRGSTYDNLANLAPTFREEVLDAYEGTTLGQQELHAEVLLDNPRALWKRSTVAGARVRPELVPDLVRVVVGVDPSGGRGEQGIVVVGRAPDTPDGRVRGHGYVLADASGRWSPDGWGRAAVAAWAEHDADLIAVEVNFGGDMARSTITAAAAAMVEEGVIPAAPAVKVLHASRGKQARAEPVAAVYEQARVHHVGVHGRLEDQLCEWVPGEGDSPDRLDALVWACTELGLAAGSRLGSFGGQMAGQPIA